MSRISNAHTVSIVAAPSTLLAQVAAAMPTRSWVEFNGTTQNGVSCAVPTNLGAYMGATFPVNTSAPTVYANKANWNPVNGCIEIIGRYHGTGVLARYARYLPTSHSFDLRTYDGDVSSINHNFDMTTVNPATGDNYVKPYNSSKIVRFASGGNMASAEAAPLTNVPSHPASSINNGIDWWSGTGAISRGAQGVLMVLENDDPASWIRTYEPIGGTWAAISVPGVPTTGPQYNGLLVYSRTKNVAIFCIGHKANTQLWRINADGTIDKYASTAPVLVHLTGSSIVADPVTGNFLVHGNRNGSFYEFNPDGAGTWTNLNTGPVAGRLPSNVNWMTDSNGFPGITVTNLYDHGVVCYLSTDGNGAANMHLYKHG